MEFDQDTMMILFSCIVLIFCSVMIKDYQLHPNHWLYNEANSSATAIVMKGFLPEVYINTSPTDTFDAPKFIPDYEIARVVPLEKPPKYISIVRYIFIILMLIVASMIIIIGMKKFNNKLEEAKE